MAFISLLRGFGDVMGGWRYGQWFYLQAASLSALYKVYKQLKTYRNLEVVQHSGTPFRHLVSCPSISSCGVCGFSFSLFLLVIWVVFECTYMFFLFFIYFFAFKFCYNSSLKYL